MILVRRVAGPGDLREFRAGPRSRSRHDAANDPVHHHTRFPDMSMTIEPILAEGNEVAVRLTARGINRGAIGGVVPPTGREFAAAQSHWFRIKGGKLAEH